MAKFRKKPVVIEAVQVRGDNPREVDTFLAEHDPDGGVRRDTETRNRSADSPDGFDYPVLRIPTLEGVMTAGPGDWIIRGVKGELYPCKPEIFEATYEEVL